MLRPCRSPPRSCVRPARADCRGTQARGRGARERSRRRRGRTGRRGPSGHGPVPAAVHRSGDRAFGVSWLLLAAVHKQETAFSTRPGTYRGLNFARLLRRPDAVQRHQRQPHTWELSGDAFRCGTAARPATRTTPEAPVGLRRLRLDDGRGAPADGRAPPARSTAAPGGRPTTTTATTPPASSYADEVVARARNWANNGFSALSEPSPGAVAAVHADYGAAALSALAPPRPPAAHTKKRRSPPAVAASSPSRTRR